MGYDITRQFPITLLELVARNENRLRLAKVTLGSTTGSQGGSGAPPGGYDGQLAQRYVSFDTTEAVLSGSIGGSGSIASLVDNLNRIRANTFVFSNTTLPANVSATAAYGIRTNGSRDDHVHSIALGNNLSWSSGSLTASVTGGTVSGSGVTSRIAQWTSSSSLGSANIIGPVTNVLTLTATAASTLALAISAGNTLTLAAAGNYNLTIPESMTTAGRDVANVFTTDQTINTQVITPNINNAGVNNNFALGMLDKTGTVYGAYIVVNGRDKIGLYGQLQLTSDIRNADASAGRISFVQYDGASFNERGAIGKLGGWTVGANPAGGDKGVGAINVAGGYYVNNVGVPTGTGVTNYPAYWSATNTLSSLSYQFAGTAGQTYIFPLASGSLAALNSTNMFTAVQEFNLNADALPADASGTVFHLGGANGGFARMLFDSFGDASVIHSRRASGSAAAPSALGSGQVITGLQAAGYGTTAYMDRRAAFYAVTEEAWSDSANGCRWDIYATPIGSGTMARVGIMEGSGRLRWAGSISIGGDSNGVASHNSITNVTNTTTTNAYVVGGGQAASTKNTGWIKGYVGTTVVWIPYWANATP